MTKPRVKSTNAEYLSRVTAVYRLLINGTSRRDIIDYAEGQQWGVTSSMVDKYITAARSEIATVTQEERDAALGLAYRRLDKLYLKSYTDGDYKTCLAIQKEINEVSGLKTTKLDVDRVVSIQFVDDVPNEDDDDCGGNNLDEVEETY